MRVVRSVRPWTFRPDCRSAIIADRPCKSTGAPPAREHASQRPPRAAARRGAARLLRRLDRRRRRGEGAIAERSVHPRRSLLCTRLTLLQHLPSADGAVPRHRGLLPPIARTGGLRPSHSHTDDHPDPSGRLDAGRPVRQPRRGGAGHLAAWPNVSLKLGGIGMPRLGFDWHARPTPIGSEELGMAMAPLITDCIAQFGPDRCMFESTFPPDKVSFSYHVLFNAFKRFSTRYSALGVRPCCMTRRCGPTESATANGATTATSDGTLPSSAGAGWASASQTAAPPLIRKSYKWGS
jgi:hypothetical protein